MSDVRESFPVHNAIVVGIPLCHSISPCIKGDATFISSTVRLFQLFFIDFLLVRKRNFATLHLPCVRHCHRADRRAASHRRVLKKVIVKLVLKRGDLIKG